MRDFGLKNPVEFNGNTQTFDIDNSNEICGVLLEDLEATNYEFNVTTQDPR